MIGEVPASTGQAIEEHRNLLIPVVGAELAADLYLPAKPGPHPVLVSYYPYHKDDIIGAAYEYANRYFASRGYGTLLVDFRGLGSSTGTAREAMHEEEATDGVAIIDWTADQPWCNGQIGMWGLSYGGITALKTAAARPSALKAIIPMMATDDIYADWFYPGGSPSMLGAFGIWGPMMLTLLLMPPTYRDDQGRWMRVWRDRLAHATPYMLDWLEHPDRDAYWTSKTIPVERIEVPTFLIGGWRDIFPEAMTRIYQRLKCTRRLLMGPWLHVQPDSSATAPVEHLDLMCAWWDRWLGAEHAEDSDDPVTYHVQGLGWHADQLFPPTGTRMERLYLDPASGLTTAPGPAQKIHYRADPTVGTSSGLWDPLGTGIGLPRDQRPDDVRSVSFTGSVLPGALTITGSPTVSLSVVPNSEGEFNLVAKLSAVGPDGASHLITTGWKRVVPDPRRSTVMERFSIELWATAFHVPAGHQIRLAISCADFPRIWPSAVNPEIDLLVGEGSDSTIELPIAPADIVPVRPPDARTDIDRAPLGHLYDPTWTVETDGASGATLVRFELHSILTTPAGQARVELRHQCACRVEPDHPETAITRSDAEAQCTFTDSTVVKVTSKTRTTRDSINLEATVELDGQVFYDFRWPRQEP